MNKRTLIRWLLGFVGPLRGKMAGAVCLGILSNLAVVTIPVYGLLQISRHLAGEAVNTSGTLLILVTLGILRGVLRYGEQYLNHDIAFSLLALLRQKIFRKLRELGPARLTGVRSGDFITSITADVEALEVFFAHTVSPVLIFGGTTVVTVGYLTSYHWLLGLILLLSLLFVGLAVPISSYRRYERIASEQRQAFVAMNQQVMEDIQSLGTIRQFDLTADKLAELRKQGQELNQLSRQKLSQESQLSIRGEAGMLAGALLILVSGIGLSLPPATVAMAVVLTLSAFGPAFSLAGLGNALLVTFASGERIYRLFQEEPQVQFPAESQGEAAVTSVDFQKVSFAYPQQEPLLEELSLALAQGESVGIGGPSGIGKSTLLKLIMRYFDPQGGNLMLNGRSLKRYSEPELQQLTGSFEQRTFIFEGTLAQNIAIGKLTATDEEIREAAAKAQLHDWIMGLPQGYQTVVGGLGRQLSDGECQRVGLARLFLKDASLLLLDEPTSNLDYLNELAILGNLTELAEGKTLLLVSHRPTTLQIAKRQYRLTKGQLE